MYREFLAFCFCHFTPVVSGNKKIYYIKCLRNKFECACIVTIEKFNNTF